MHLASAPDCQINSDCSCIYAGSPIKCLWFSGPCDGVIAARYGSGYVQLRFL
jgi:hypothetical protein